MTAQQERERFLAMVRGGTTADDENDDHKAYLG